MGPDLAEASGTRSRLLEAAQRHFAAEGFEAAGVAAILASAGVHAPTLYYHFGDKEGLYSAACTACLADLGAELRRAVDAPSTLREGLVRATEILSDAAKLDLGLLTRDLAKLQSPANREAVTGAYLEHVHEPICGLLLRGIQSGQLRGDAIGKMAGIFIVGALAARLNLPGASLGSDASWWADRYLAAFGC